jgi:hypothetical protein
METSVLLRATWHNIPEDDILHSHCHENLKSYECVFPHVTKLFQNYRGVATTFYPNLAFIPVLPLKNVETEASIS